MRALRFFRVTMSVIRLFDPWFSYTVTIRCPSKSHDYLNDGRSCECNSVTSGSIQGTERNQCRDHSPFQQSYPYPGGGFPFHRMFPVAVRSRGRQPD